MPLFRVLGLAAWIWVASLGSAFAAGAGSAPSAAAADPAMDSAQQVLVLLRLPSEHFRPNSDYSGGYGGGMGASVRRKLAARLAHKYGLTQVTDWPMPMLGLDCIVLGVPPDRSPREVAALLSHDPGVAWSQPMNVFRAQGHLGAYNDPLYPAQPAAAEWRLADLHELATGRNVRVAVIDSQVDRTHPDLTGQVAVSEDFADGHPEVPELHGTGVAGVIAAVGDNHLGIVGVAPEARLMALRACWQGGAATVCDTLSLAKALYFATTHGAQVINLSLSGPPDLLLSKLLDAALGRGVIVVGAFDRNLPDGGFPASHAGVVAVADESQGRPRAGVYTAPGAAVPTAEPGGRWFLANGSSYAAAHVSGLFALLRESGRRNDSTRLVTTRAAAGSIDPCATLIQALGPCSCACARAAR